MNRRFPFPGFLLPVLFLLILSAAPSVRALDTPEVAILLKGPVAKKGIDVLYPNAIPCYFGEYSYGSETVRVYYTEEPIAVRDAWALFGCAGTEGVLRLPERRNLVLYHEDPRGWKVFFLFSSSGGSGPDACGFITVFLGRLRYFLGISGDEEIVPLPAVLQFQ